MSLTKPWSSQQSPSSIKWLLWSNISIAALQTAIRSLAEVRVPCKVFPCSHASKVWCWLRKPAHDLAISTMHSPSFAYPIRQIFGASSFENPNEMLHKCSQNHAQGTIEHLGEIWQQEMALAVTGQPGMFSSKYTCALWLASSMVCFTERRSVTIPANTFSASSGEQSSTPEILVTVGAWACIMERALGIGLQIDWGQSKAKEKKATDWT